VTRSYAIQPVRPEDVPAVVSMVHELADFEKAPELCHLTEADLHAALFGDGPKLFGHVAHDTATGEPLAMSLWFLNFSTWEGRHGVYLEDLYVRPAARGRGLGRAMLATLARECVEHGYPRLQLGFGLESGPRVLPLAGGAGDHRVGSVPAERGGPGGSRCHRRRGLESPRR